MTTEHTTLREYLILGSDPSKLPSYGAMIDQVVDITIDGPDKATESAQFHRWMAEQVDSEGYWAESSGPKYADGRRANILRSIPGGGGWDSVDQFVTAQLMHAELAEDPDVREMFVRALPDKDRAELDQRVWELDQPLMQIEPMVDTEDRECTTCGSPIPAGERHAVMDERWFDKAPGNYDHRICAGCLRRVTPIEAGVN